MSDNAMHWAEAALREREEQYQSIFESVSDGIVINEIETGLVVEANPAMCAMHGYTRDEMIGLHPTAFIHPDYHAIFEEYVQSVLTDGEYRARAVDLHKDGTPFYVEVQGTQLTFRGKPHILGVLRDVTPREVSFQLLEQRVAERTRELSTLLDLAQQVAGTLELRPLFGIILDQLKAITDYDGASILMLDGDALEIVDARGMNGRAADAIGARFDLEEIASLWDSIAARKPVLIDDVIADNPLATGYREIFSHYPKVDVFAWVRSWIAVPLPLQDRVIGAVTLSRSRPRWYNQRHVALAAAIAANAAVAIENARLYEQAQALAALEERQRLARDLHDSVTQQLFSLRMLTHAAQAQHTRGTPALATTLERIDLLAQEALSEMRTLLRALQPGTLADGGLTRALDKLITSFRGRTDLTIVFSATATLRPTAEQETAIYRIVQEALANIDKHAKATTVWVIVADHEGRLRVTVTDNGTGFDPNAVRLPSEDGRHGGMGMRSMRERAAAAGLTLDVHSAPGEGAAVTITV